MAAPQNQRRCKWVIWLLVLAFVTGALSAQKLSSPKPEKITVTILAISTMTWQGYAGDEEILLASLVDRKGNRQLIRLSDWTPSGTGSSSGMSVGQRYRMVATRTPWCDSTSSSFFLPPSAGDRSQFFPPDTSGKEALPVPCYFDRHDSIRAERKARSIASLQ